MGLPAPGPVGQAQADAAGDGRATADPAPTLGARRRRPRFSRVEGSGHLWHLDITSVWVAEHDWVYLKRDHRPLHARHRGLDLSFRCRAHVAIAVGQDAVEAQGIQPGRLTLDTDNGSAFTPRARRLVLSGLGVAHRRGGYCSP